MIRKARFPADQRSVLHARRLVSDAVVDVPDHVSEALALITSELATNAVRHGPSGFEIRIEQRSDCIHIEVEDDGGGAPIVRAPGLSETSGRGLQIVGALADEWGVIPRDGSEGKTVWARVTLPAVDDRLSARPTAPRIEMTATPGGPRAHREPPDHRRASGRSGPTVRPHGPRYVGPGERRARRPVRRHDASRLATTTGSRSALPGACSA